MRKTIRCLAIAMLLMGLWMLWPSVQAETEHPRLVCLNIGKADCMLLQYQDSNYLIDTGYAHTYTALETMLRQYDVTHLDGVILTHCHKDHQGSLEQLGESDWPVGAWYAGALYTGVKAKKHPAVKAAAQRGQEPIWLEAGDTLPVGNDGTLTVLAPLSLNEDNENNNSLVLLFSCPDGSMLLAGDMKDEEEQELLQAGTLSPCQFLKVGHHGDNKATSAALVQQLKPQVAFILTATEEEPDTPAASALRNLKAAGCQVYISQDAQDALEVTLKAGQALVRDVVWEDISDRLTDVWLELDLAQDVVTIGNDGAEEINLDGWTMYSFKGNETLILEDVRLKPGQQYRIGSRATETECDLYWDDKRVWHESKRDLAILYDAYGRPVAYADNGIEDE